ncbi:MAG: endonuclease III domain-containing protein [Syntrophales bacterium]|nr:endonuclease III domain-containing protein [Syntrophales bacterium]
MDHREELLKIYKLLDGYFGDLHWWPAVNPFEVMVGAILTQNTAWTNVETAIKALRKRRLLTPAALSRIPEDDLAEVIRASGYYHLKAARLKAFVRFFMDDYSGSVAAMKAEGLPLLRKKLLGVRGVGPETADSILLYACQKPIFISDAYTRRILLRHGLIDEAADYDGIQSLVMASLPNDVNLFNQFHALIVVAAKTFCRKRPECADCPLAILNIRRKIC